LFFTLLLCLLLFEKHDDLIVLGLLSSSIRSILSPLRLALEMAELNALTIEERT